MELHRLDTMEEAAELVNGWVSRTVKVKWATTFGWATGRTMVPIYARIRQALKDKEYTFKHSTSFTLDEYWNVKYTDSYECYMDTHLPNRGTECRLDGDSTDHAEECQRYEWEIDDVGGIDLLVCGIGNNGHIAFNEPGSAFDSRTRPVRLSEETRKQNQFAFEGEVPQFALTMGIGTILESKTIICIAGPDKKDIAWKAVYTPFTEEIPATALKKHPDSHLIIVGG